MSALLVLIALFVIAILLLAVNGPSVWKRQKKLPPGPGRLEAVYSFLSTLLSNRTYLAEIGRRYAWKYGEVVLLPLPFGNNIVFLNSASAVRDLYTDKATEEHANGRLQLHVGACLFKNDVAFNPPKFDPNWTKARKLFYSSLKFYGDGVARFESIVEHAIHRLLTGLEKQNGQDLNPKEYFQTSVLVMLTLLLTGKLEEDESPVIKAITRFNAAVNKVLDAKFHYTTLICPVSIYVPGSWSKKLWDDVKSTKRTVEKLLFTLAFGVGKRQCPGETFARARLFLYLTSLVQHFDILPPQSHEMPVWSEEQWIVRETVEMKPFYCQLRKRSK